MWLGGGNRPGRPFAAVADWRDRLTVVVSVPAQAMRGRPAGESRCIRMIRVRTLVVVALRGNPGHSRRRNLVHSHGGNSGRLGLPPEEEEGCLLVRPERSFSP